VFIDQWKADTALYGSGNSLYHVLLNAGILCVDSFTTPRAFGAVYQKGNPAFVAKYQVTPGIYEAVALSVDCTTPALNGTLQSPLFGPAKAWKKLQWRGSSQESPATDNASLDLIGVDTTGNISVLRSGLGFADQDYDVSSIDAKKYPYLQLKMRLQDTVKGTPYQLRYWRLTDDPAPEGALAANLYLSGKDTVEQGEILNFGIAFKNVSPTAFDSMAIKVNIIDKNNVTHTLTLPKKKPLLSGDTLIVSFQLDTKTYPGANTMYLDVNPNNSQPEQYHFNNFLYKGFYVLGDDRKPTLDVTFDNVHILNDDIVSAKPHIQIKLKSLNNYLLLTDTSLITLQMKYPDDVVRVIGFNNDSVKFAPATSGSDNTATVDFMPNLTKQVNASGDTYELIVSGKDEVGNAAGSAAYRVAFKVIAKPMISNMLNYPNPFTTSTAFVFTITGSEVPQDMKIQILTITGKIVREITKDELGPLHVGRNITEFKWNGTDMYGQRLANGVYLYHVVTNLNGHSLDKYKSAGDNTDKYFNNGYGKMYLMR
jgi:flagellar hook assembly protein FlgD